MDNPFQKPGIGSFIYYDGVNSEVRDTILHIFRRAQGLYSIAVTGDPGTGKTTLLKHIKNQVEEQDNSVCIVINGNRLLSLNAIAYYTLQIVIEDLIKPPYNHLEEIAKNIYDQSVTYLNSDQRFDVEKICRKYQEKNPELNGNIDIDILRAILWTLDTISEQNEIDYTMMPIAIKWLKGQDINEDEANILRLPRQSSEIRKDEESSLQRLRFMLLIIAKYKKLIIAFDEWESDVIEPTGLERSTAIADFVKILHDNLDDIDTKSSIFILSSLLKNTWQKLINSAAKKATVARICSWPEFQEKPLRLDQTLSVNQALELVSFWLKSVSGNQTEFYDPYYPFARNDIENFAKPGRTPRHLWQWCAANWSDCQNDTLENRFNKLLNKLASHLISYDDDDIADLLYWIFNDLEGHTVAKVTITEVHKMYQKDKFQLKIMVFDIPSNKIVSTGLGICQKTARTAGAMLKCLLQYKQHNLDRGYFLRPQLPGFELNPKIQAGQLLNQLITQQDGKAINLVKQDIFELYVLKQAIQDLCEKKEGLKQDDSDFRREILMKNKLVREILSSP